MNLKNKILIEEDKDLVLKMSFTNDNINQKIDLINDFPLTYLITKFYNINNSIIDDKRKLKDNYSKKNINANYGPNLFETETINEYIEHQIKDRVLILGEILSKVKKILLIDNINIDIYNNVGLTPIIIASRGNSYNFNKYKLVKLLIDNGANINKTTKKNKNLYDYTINKKVKKLLLKNGLVKSNKNIFEDNKKIIYNKIKRNNTNTSKIISNLKKKNLLNEVQNFDGVNLDDGNYIKQITYKLLKKLFDGKNTIKEIITNIFNGIDYSSSNIINKYIDRPYKYKHKKYDLDETFLTYLIRLIGLKNKPFYGIKPINPDLVNNLFLILEHLLDIQNLDLYKYGDNGFTPLTLIILAENRENKLKMLNLFLNKGIDVNRKNRNKKSTLWYLKNVNDDNEVFDILLNLGANLKIKSNNKKKKNKNYFGYIKNNDVFVNDIFLYHLKDVKIRINLSTKMTSDCIPKFEGSTNNRYSNRSSIEYYRRTKRNKKNIIIQNMYKKNLDFKNSFVATRIRFEKKNKLNTFFDKKNIAFKPYYQQHFSSKEDEISEIQNNLFDIVNKGKVLNFSDYEIGDRYRLEEANVSIIYNKDRNILEFKSDYSNEFFNSLLIQYVYNKFLKDNSENLYGAAKCYSIALQESSGLSYYNDIPVDYIISLEFYSDLYKFYIGVGTSFNSSLYRPEYGKASFNNSLSKFFTPNLLLTNFLKEPFLKIGDNIDLNEYKYTYNNPNKKVTIKDFENTYNYILKEVLAKKIDIQTKFFITQILQYGDIEIGHWSDSIEDIRKKFTYGLNEKNNEIIKKLKLLNKREPLFDLLPRIKFYFNNSSLNINLISEFINNNIDKINDNSYNVDLLVEIFIDKYNKPEFYQNNKYLEKYDIFYSHSMIIKQDLINIINSYKKYVNFIKNILPKRIENLINFNLSYKYFMKNIDDDPITEKKSIQEEEMPLGTKPFHEDLERFGDLYLEALNDSYFYGFTTLKKMLKETILYFNLGFCLSQNNINELREIFYNNLGIRFPKRKLDYTFIAEFFYAFKYLNLSFKFNLKRFKSIPYNNNNKFDIFYDRNLIERYFVPYETTREILKSFNKKIIYNINDRIFKVQSKNETFFNYFLKYGYNEPLYEDSLFASANIVYNPNFNPNITDSFGYPSLTLAIMLPEKKIKYYIVNLLLNHVDLEINKRDYSRKTALWHVENNFYDKVLIKMLKSKGATW